MSRESAAAAATTTRGGRGAFPAASDATAPPDAAVREAVESILVAEATGGEPIRRPIAVGEEEGEEESESAAARPPPPSVCRAVDRILRVGGGGEGGGRSEEESSVAASAAAAASGALACYGETVRPAVVRDVARNDGGEAADGVGGSGDVGTEGGADVAFIVPGGASAVLRYEAFLSELVAAATVGAAGGSLSGRGGTASEEDRRAGARRDGTSAAVGPGLREFRGYDSGEKHGGADSEASAAIHTLCGAICTVSFDVIALTACKELSACSDAEAKEDEASSARRREARNVVLPALLRILTHAVRLLGMKLSQMQRSSKTNGEQKKKGQQRLSEVCQESLAVVVLTAAAFVSGEETEQASGGMQSSFSPTSISPCLDEELSPSRSVASCSYPPVTGSDWDVLIAENGDVCGVEKSFLSNPAVDLESAAMSSPWMDTISGAGQKAGMELLRTVVELAGVGLNLDADWSSDGEHQHLTLLRRAVHISGLEVMAKVSRAHFYGRLTAPSHVASTRNGRNLALVSAKSRSVVAANARGPWFSPRRSPQDHANNVPATLPHNRIPSRVHSCLRVLRSLRFPDVVAPALEDLFPICYTLIDSHDTTHQALGAAALLHLMKECTPTAFAPHKDMAGTVLELGCRICRDNAALAILSRARAALFANFAPAGGPDASLSCAAPRRKATFDLLALVRMQRGDDKPLLAGVLIGGINPLVAQRADLPNADAMELLRPGLMTLLPLIRWDGSGAASRTVQLAALVGLTSLLMGAHPLAPRHGGKIMAEVLSCLGRAERDLAIGEKVRGKADLSSSIDSREHLAAKAVSALAQHVAAVVLVLCKQSADAVLLAVEGGSYDPNLVRWCSKIRQEVRSFLLIEEEAKTGAGFDQCNHGHLEMNGAM